MTENWWVVGLYFVVIDLALCLPNERQAIIAR